MSSNVTYFWKSGKSKYILVLVLVKVVFVLYLSPKIINYYNLLLYVRLGYALLIYKKNVKDD